MPPLPRSKRMPRDALTSKSRMRTNSPQARGDAAVPTFAIPDISCTNLTIMCFEHVKRFGRHILNMLDVKLLAKLALLKQVLQKPRSANKLQQTCVTRAGVIKLATYRLNCTVLT